MPAAPRRPINPELLICVERSGKVKRHIAFVAGYPFYAAFYEALRADRIPATPLTIQRLQRVADAIGFPRADIFLDEVAQ